MWDIFSRLADISIGKRMSLLRVASSGLNANRSYTRMAGVTSEVRGHTLRMIYLKLEKHAYSGAIST